jgi:hypothetical protein
MVQRLRLYRILLTGLRLRNFPLWLELAQHHRETMTA